MNSFALNIMKAYIIWPLIDLSNLVMIYNLDELPNKFK